MGGNREGHHPLAAGTAIVIIQLQNTGLTADSNQRSLRNNRQRRFHESI